MLPSRKRADGPYKTVNGRHRDLLQTISISFTRLAWRHRLMARLAARAAVSQGDCKNRHNKIISISLLQLGRTVEGNFKASAEAAGLSRAVLFNGSPIPATVRFSDSTGIPNIADGSTNANPHGMAIKFHLPDGSDTDMMINSLKFFPVATGEDFRDLLLALAASPP